MSEQIAVKIRDLSKISAVLNLAGKYGATEVSGLSFTIDDPKILKPKPDKALADAKVKAQALAGSLGVKMVSVVSYYENEGSNGYYPVMSKSLEMGLGGIGGGGVAPVDVSGGSQDVVMNVSVTYEISPSYSYKRW